MKIALNLISAGCLLLVISHLLYLHNLNKSLKQAIKELCVMDNFDKAYFITGYEDGWLHASPQEDIIYTYLMDDDFWRNRKNWEEIELQHLHEHIWNWKNAEYYEIKLRD